VDVFRLEPRRRTPEETEVELEFGVYENFKQDPEHLFTNLGETHASYNHRFMNWNASNDHLVPALEHQPHEASSVQYKFDDETKVYKLKQMYGFNPNETAHKFRYLNGVVLPYILFQDQERVNARRFELAAGIGGDTLVPQEQWLPEDPDSMEGIPKDCERRWDLVGKHVHYDHFEESWGELSEVFRRIDPPIQYDGERLDQWSRFPGVGTCLDFQEILAAIINNQGGRRTAKTWFLNNEGYLPGCWKSMIRTSDTCSLPDDSHMDSQNS
jgi:hypothetical protein